MTSTISSEKQLKKLELLEQLKLLHVRTLTPEQPKGLSLENDREEQATTQQKSSPEIEDNETIEAPKKIKRIVKPRTEKQIESLSKGRQKMAQNQEDKRQIKKQETIIYKQDLEKKLIEKAIKIKKKQLKKIEIFDDLSDDDDTVPPTIQKPKSKQVIQPIIVICR